MTYRIFRHCYTMPDFLDNDLSIENSDFEFDSLIDAMYCLSNCFENGAWIYDGKYGRCRYYIAPEPQKGGDINA